LVPGFQSPTADLNTTLSFAVIAVVTVNVIAIREIGLVAYLKHFAGEPVWLSWMMFPLHVMGEFAKVVSLAVRLYGNMFAKETLMVVLMGFSPVLILGHFEVPFVPIQLPIMLFGLFVGFLQAMIFALLVSIYLGQFLEEHDH
jgi:F-type H+-transporting ATPase subunit a